MESNRTVDDTLEVLADAERRRILAYFEDSDDAATVAELATHLATESDRSAPVTQVERSLEARLHHVHLPKLEEYGVVEYDARSGAVRRSTDERVEELLEYLETEIEQ